MISHFVRKLRGIVLPTAGDRTVTVGGLVWHVAPGETAPDLAACRAAGLAVVVKKNVQRTIERVRLPRDAGVVFAKTCRVNTPRAWLRDVLRPPKARLEFENAVALRNLGIAVVAPVAWGSARGLLPAASVFVTREQPGAVPLPDLLETVLPGLPPAAARAVRRQLARGLGRFLATMHDAGVAHPDPHPGNLLVELPPTRVPRFVLIDVHAVRFGPPLTAAETLANLTLFNRYFQLRATRADRLRFWREYARTRESCGVTPRDLEAATARSNHRFWANRVGRYVTTNREFRRVRGPQTRGYAVQDFDREYLATWLADPDGPFRDPEVKLLKDGRSSTVAVVEVAGVPVVLKRFRLKTPAAGLKNLFRPSAALRSWVLGHNLRDRGLPTPRPLTMFHRVRLGVPLEGYVAFEAVPDSYGLNDAVGRQSDFRPLRTWADRVGRLLRDLHDRQVSHRDLKAANILISGPDPATAVPVLIDLVGVTTGTDVPVRVRVRELARLNASFHATPSVTRTDRLRVLRAYQRWALHGRGDWKTWWRAIAAATSAKVARNAKRGRVLG